MNVRAGRASARNGRKGAWAPAFLIAALLPFSVIPALATTVRRVGLERIVEASDTIVEGRVESIRSFWRGKQILPENSVGGAPPPHGQRADRVPVLQAGGGGGSPRPVGMTGP